MHRINRKTKQIEEIIQDYMDKTKTKNVYMETMEKVKTRYKNLRKLHKSN